MQWKSSRPDPRTGTPTLGSCPQNRKTLRRPFDKRLAIDSTLSLCQVIKGRRPSRPGDRRTDTSALNSEESHHEIELARPAAGMVRAVPEAPGQDGSGTIAISA